MLSVLIFLYVESYYIDNHLLLSSGSRSKSGAIFWKRKVKVSEGWETRFSFRLTCGVICGDGFTFLIQSKDPLTLGECPRTSSWCHGYRGISPSFATIFNSAIKSEVAFANNGSTPSQSAIPTSIHFSDGNIHSAHIIYDANRQSMDVYIDEILQTSYIMLNHELSPNSSLSEAWIGFSGHSGLLDTEKIEIISWSFDTTMTVPKLSHILQDGEDVAKVNDAFNITLVSRNSCKQQRIWGGDIWSVYFVSGFRDQFPGKVYDAHDGTYIVEGKLFEVGTYEVVGLLNDEEVSLGFIKICK